MQGMYRVRREVRRRQQNPVSRRALRNWQKKTTPWRLRWPAAYSWPAISRERTRCPMEKWLRTASLNTTGWPSSVIMSTTAWHWGIPPIKRIALIFRCPAAEACWWTGTTLMPCPRPSACSGRRMWNGSWRRWQRITRSSRWRKNWMTWRTAMMWITVRKHRRPPTRTRQRERILPGRPESREKRI